MSEDAKQGQVVTGVTNNLEIEMKVSKQEVVDMIVQEQEDALDDEIAKVTKEVNKVKANGKNLVDTFKLAVPKLGTSKAAKVVEALEKLYPDQKTRVVTQISLESNERYNEETDAKEPIVTPSAEETSALKTYNDFGLRSYDRRENHFFDVAINVSLFPKGFKPGSTQAVGNLPVNGSLREELLALPEFKALATFGSALDDLNERLQELSTERSKLVSLGKRAKGKIIRQMLESSDNGKAILAGTRKLGKLQLTAPKTEE